MSEEQTGPPDADLDLRKKRVDRRRRRSTSVRRTLVATSELFQDLASAAADAFAAFAEEIGGSNPSDDLISTVSSGLAEGNERYLQRVSGASRRFVDRMRSSDEPPSQTIDIDYDRLAKMVVAELERRHVAAPNEPVAAKSRSSTAGASGRAD